MYIPLGARPYLGDIDSAMMRAPGVAERTLGVPLPWLAPGLCLSLVFRWAVLLWVDPTGWNRPCRVALFRFDFFVRFRVVLVCLGRRYT